MTQVAGGHLALLVILRDLVTESSSADCFKEFISLKNSVVIKYEYDKSELCLRTSDWTKQK